MKQYFSFSFFLAATLLLSSCNSENLEAAQDSRANVQGMVLVHTFKDKAGAILGNVYTNAGADEQFDRLTILNDATSDQKILYQIEKTKLLDSVEHLEGEMAPEGFRGYRLLLASKEHIVLSCCGENVSDDLVIRWESSSGTFHLLLTP